MTHANIKTKASDYETDYNFKRTNLPWLIQASFKQQIKEIAHD